MCFGMQTCCFDYLTSNYCAEHNKICKVISESEIFIMFWIEACIHFFPFIFWKELEELRKQGEVIPQLMSECESVSQQLQVEFSNDINFKLVYTFNFILMTVCFSLFRLQCLKAKELRFVKKLHAKYTVPFPAQE